MAKLYGYARYRIRGAKFQVKGKTYEDFAHEAIKLVMEGTRTIPDWVTDSETSLKFMTSVVSSLVSNDFSSKEMGMPAIPIEDTIEPSVPSEADESLIAAQEYEESKKVMAKLREALATKQNALKCFDAYQEVDIEEAGGQINKLLATKTGLSVNEIVAAKKQISRTLQSIKDGKK